MIDLHLSAFAPRWRFLYVVRIDAYISLIICGIKRDKQACFSLFVSFVNGVRKDGFAFLIDGFELSNLTNLDNISFS